MNKLTLLSLALGLTFSGLTFAKVDEAQVKKLSGELTPMGAVRGANADGSIPEWTGGITTLLLVILLVCII